MMSNLFHQHKNSHLLNSQVRIELILSCQVMFKRKPIQLKHTARQQLSLSNTTNQRSTRSKIQLVIHPLRGKSKDSKSSLNNQQPKPRSSSKQPCCPRKTPPLNPKPTPKRPIDLLSQYDNVIRLSQKMNDRQKQPTTREHQYRSLPQQPTKLQEDSLMCDEELEMQRQPFPILRTPSPLRSVRDVTATGVKGFEKYGLELSVVEERIISEEDRELVSEKKKKTHLRMPTASTADRASNTAKANHEANMHHRSTSPFQLTSKPRKQTRKISINVHSLMAKCRRPDSKHPSSQNTMR